MKELDRAVLTEDMPEHGLEKDDIGTVVMVYADGAGYEVEFMTLGGDTVAVVTVSASQVRPGGGGEIPHARPVSG